MSLFKGKFQIKKYADIIGDEKIDKLQPAIHKIKKYFKEQNFSGSLGKRDQGKFMYRPYLKSVSRSLFVNLQEQGIKTGSARDTSRQGVIEHRIVNQSPFRGQIVVLSEYDTKPATASMSGSPSIGSTIARGSVISLSNTSTGSLSAVSWSFFPTARVSKSDGTPVGQIGLLSATKYYIRTGSEVSDDIIIKTEAQNFGDAQQVAFIKVEGDYLDTVTYDQIPHAWNFS